MLIQDLISHVPGQRLAFAGPQPVTYRQLGEQVRRYRDYFYHHGIRPGDNVGLLAKNSPEFIYSYLGIVSLRAAVVPINFQLAPREINYIIHDADMKALVTMTALDPAPDEADDAHVPVQQLLIPEINRRLADTAAAPPLAPGNEEETCVIIYTSGTTGSPKGAMLSHKNLLSNVRSFTQKLPVCADDVVLCVLPMYHAFAWTCPVLGSFMYGASIVIADTFSREIVATIRENKITLVYAIPAMYEYLLQWAEPEDCQTVKLFASGGASLPPTIVTAFNRKFGQPVREGYGLSEAAPAVAFNPLEKVKPSSIGKALPGIAIRIVDEADRDVPAGACGELLVAGPNVMRGYYRRPAETAAALRGGWLHTGDIACQDDEGYLYIKDRLKDLIVTMGQNVYPREVEELLNTYPGIAESAVIGVDDPIRGQAVCAILVCQPDQSLKLKDLRTYLRHRVALYKVPRVFAVTNGLPKNALGKVLKKVLRQQAPAIIATGRLT